MKLSSGYCVEMPDWVPEYVSQWPRALDTTEEAMRLAIALSAENVEQRTGGPFGAVVVEEQSGRVLGAGINCVTESGISLAHAEMVAISLAQSAIGHWNIGAAGQVLLATSCEPCAMCYGAVPWSGVTSLAWGANKDDAEACGFDEGEKPADWQAALNRRGISTRGDVLRTEAAAVLHRYAQTDGEIYHPSRSDGNESC